MENCRVTGFWLFSTSTEKDASPMEEIFPVTDPCSVAPLRNLGWEAIASDETATLKHAIKTVKVNRKTSVTMARKRMYVPFFSLAGNSVMRTNLSKLETTFRFSKRITISYITRLALWENT